MQPLFPILLLLLFFSSSVLWAHGDLDERIAAKTQAIIVAPNNGQLYAERGFLYQQHQDWQEALQDYQQAQLLGITDKVISFRQAEIYLALEDYDKGLSCTQQYWLQDSIDVKLHRLRGELYWGKQDYEAAILAFRYVLEHAQDVRPENYLTLAAVYYAQDAGSTTPITVLEEGLTHFGQQLFVLQEQKLYYLQHLQEHKAVFKQFDNIINQLQRKEAWYYKKAHYLYQQQRYKAAKTSLTQAKEAFHLLPPQKQKTASMLRLWVKICQLEVLLQQ